MKLSQLLIIVILCAGFSTITYAQKKKAAPAPPSSKYEPKKVKTSNTTSKLQVKKSKTKNTLISEKPGFKTVNDKQYFVINDKWFSKENGNYKLVEKPVGVSQIKAANKTAKSKTDAAAIKKEQQQITNYGWMNTPLQITHNNQQYHFFAGYWFLKENGSYKKIKAPIHAEVPFLPEEATEVIENGNAYYNYRDTKYVKTGKGTYIVIN